MRLEGRIAVITGGNSGIGLAIARAFRLERAKIAILGRDPDTLAAAVDELGSGTLAVRGDISVPEDLDRLFSEVDSTFGQIDILVANAAIYSSAPLEQITLEFFDAMNELSAQPQSSAHR